MKVYKGFTPLQTKSGFSQIHHFSFLKKRTLLNLSRTSVTGFTLIELLVVISIIGFLSTLAITSLNSARMKARDTKRLAMVKQIQTAMEFFNNDFGGYPMVAAAINMGEGNDVCLVPNPPDAFYPADSCAGSGWVAYIRIDAPPNASTENYRYMGRNDTDTADCTSGTTCPSYRISFTTELLPAGLPTNCSPQTSFNARPGGIGC